MFQTTSLSEKEDNTEFFFTSKQLHLYLKYFNLFLTFAYYLSICSLLTTTMCIQFNIINARQTKMSLKNMVGLLIVDIILYQFINRYFKFRLDFQQG